MRIPKTQAGNVMREYARRFNRTPASQWMHESNRPEMIRRLKAALKKGEPDSALHGPDDLRKPVPIDLTDVENSSGPECDKSPEQPPET